MKQLRTIFFFFLALGTAACDGSATYTPSDFTVEIYTPAYASGFDIRGTHRSDAKLLTVRNPWQGAGNVEQHLLILPTGAKAPAQFDGQVVAAPVQRVVCMSSSHVAMFDAIAQVGRIAGVSGIGYITNSAIHTGRVRDVGYDTNLDFELLASMRPDLILLYGVTGENTLVMGKLRELKIPYIYIGDYMEQSPLGKAEWLVTVAELCGMREQGVAIFDGIVRRYEAIKAAVGQRGSVPRPKVMLNTPYRDTWFMPSSRSFMVRLIEDAGGAYIYTANTSNTSVAVDTEQAYLLASEADIWLNPGTCNTHAELTAQNPKFAGVRAVRRDMVFNNNRRQTPGGGSDFWESGVVRPDLVLRDLRAIMLYAERNASIDRVVNAQDASGTAGTPSALPDATTTSIDTLYYYKRLAR